MSTTSTARVRVIVAVMLALFVCGGFSTLTTKSTAHPSVSVTTTQPDAVMAKGFWSTLRALWDDPTCCRVASLSPSVAKLAASLSPVTTLHAQGGEICTHIWHEYDFWQQQYNYWMTLYDYFGSESYLYMAYDALRYMGYAGNAADLNGC